MRGIPAGVPYGCDRHLLRIARRKMNGVQCPAFLSARNVVLVQPSGAGGH
jgi:hypothetical protein